MPIGRRLRLYALGLGLSALTYGLVKGFDPPRILVGLVLVGLAGTLLLQRAHKPPGGRRINREEAGALLAEHVQRLRTLSFAQLMTYKDPQNEEVNGPSGTTYQIETQSFFDDKKSEVLRVLASIDDGGRSALVPMTSDFLIAPDGTFVGESPD